MINTEQLEDSIFDLEGVRVVIRASKYQTFEEYPYVRRASGNMSIKDWLNTRIKKHVGDFEVTVIDGAGQSPHGRTNMETVRNNYRD